MATIITNQATLNYRYGNNSYRAVSNRTTTVLNGALSISKRSLTETYRVGRDIGYIIGITNNSSETVCNVTVTDNLGTFSENGNSYTPLTFIGPAQLFINGIFDSVIPADNDTDSITFVIPSLPANANAQIIYIARVNEFASGEAGSEITNTATATADCDCVCADTVSTEHTVTAEEYTDVRIVKTASPNPVNCGGTLRYTFDIYNYGNQAATEVVLTDTFDPALADIRVTVDGETIAAENYSYIGGTLTLPAAASDYEIEVGPATFSRDPDTGIITVIPSAVQIVVTGTI